jgi:hypothetical protein
MLRTAARRYRRAAPGCNIFFIMPLDEFPPLPLPSGSAPECAAAAQPALRLPVAHHATTGRSLPLHPRCSATGVPGQPAPYVHPNSMRARWDNVSHTARGGVDNQVDDSARRARSVGVTSATPPVAEWTTTTTPPLRGAPTSRFALATTSNTPRRTAAAGPATPLCFATGGGGARGSSLGIQQAHRWRDLEYAITIPTSIGVRPRSRFAPSNTSCRFERPRRSQRARLPSTLSLSRWLLPLAPHRTPTASRRRMPTSKPTPAEPRTLPDRCVRARLRCSSRASLPLTPQAGTPTATIGMRPATSLR